MAFIGQIRCLLGLNLKHAHIPEITEWTITQCDINKDVRMADTFHQNAINVQVKHMDRIFRVYIKSMGADTVCRVEESLSPKKPAIKVIADLMNPTGRLEDKFTALQSQVAALQLQTPSMGANN